jgi:hypothetical protein
MKIFRRLFKDEVKQIIDLAKENERIKRAITNMMVKVCYAQSGKDWDYLIEKTECKEELRYLSQQIEELFSENKKLKEENEKQKKELEGCAKEPTAFLEFTTGLGTTKVNADLLPELCKDCCNLTDPRKEACKLCKDPFGSLYNAKPLNGKFIPAACHNCINDNKEECKECNALGFIYKKVKV